jgi:hypothetical protein
MRTRSLPALALALLAFSSRILAQAPANDGFASAQILAGPSATATGNNTLATLEAGEVNPGGQGGASVWFTWTAPASGWHTVHTSSNNPANGLDTVIALYAGGTTVSNTAMLGHNNTSTRFPADFPPAVYPGGTGPSRLVFEATAGITYRIAVHGYSGTTGPFEIQIAPEATPEFIVSSVSFAPATADITGGPAGTTASLQILTQNPFGFAGVSLMRASNGSEFAASFISSTDRTAGTPTNGTYPGVFTVSGPESPGQWPVLVGSYSNMLNSMIEWSSKGNDRVEDDYLIPQDPATLTVQNSGTVDTTAPQLTSLTLAPASFDLSSGDAALQLDFQFSDALSGLKLAKLQLVGNGTETTLADLDLTWSTPATGNANSGTFSFPVSLTAGSIPPGTYDVVVTLTDSTFNQRTYGPAGEVMPPGSTGTFVNTASPPANNHFANRITLGPALPVTTTGSTIYGTLEPGESNLNGLVGASVWYQWTAPSSAWTSLSAGTTGSNRPVFAVFTGNSIASLQEQGRSDNSTTSGGVPGPLVFQATAGTTYHIAVYGFAFGESVSPGTFSLTLESIAPPAARVTTFSLTPSTVDVATGPQSVTLQVNLATDTPFGFGSYLNAYLTPTGSTFGGSAVSVFIPNTARTAGSDTNGTYQATITLPGWHEPGLWNLVVEVSHEGLSRWSASGANIIGDKFLIPQAGGQVNLTNSGTVDAAPPVLTALSGLPAFADVTDPVPVTLTLTITDDASGFTSGQLYLNTDSGGGSTSYGLGSFGPAQRTSGTATNGTYQVSFDLTNSLIEGEYSLQVDLNDASGRLGRYGGFLGNVFPSGSTSNVTISYGPTGGYSTWAALQNFGPGGQDEPLEDANQDGTENLLCYAFNLPPYPDFASPMTAGGNSGLPLVTVVGEGANRRVRIEFLRQRSPGGLSYLPQFCSDPASAGLDGWQTAVTPPPVVIDANWERVIVEDSITGAARRFGRVVVSQSGP